MNSRKARQLRKKAYDMSNSKNNKLEFKVDKKDIRSVKDKKTGKLKKVYTKHSGIRYTDDSPRNIYQDLKRSYKQHKDILNT